MRAAGAGEGDGCSGGQAEDENAEEAADERGGEDGQKAGHVDCVHHAGGRWVRRIDWMDGVNAGVGDLEM
jgi:hypothetical protein